MRFLASLGVFVLLAASTAQAAPLQYVLEPSATSVSVGSTITVNVYLQNTGLSTDEFETLYGAGAKVTQTGGSGTVSVGAITPNPVVDPTMPVQDSLITFPDSPSTNFAGTGESGDLAGIYATLNAGDALYFPTEIGDSNRILVGSFTFTGETVGPVTLIAREFGNDVNPIFGDFGLFAADPSAAVTINVIPEPASIFAFGAIASGAGAYLWRRRRAKAAV